MSFVCDVYGVCVVCVCGEYGVCVKCVCVSGVYTGCGHIWERPATTKDLGRMCWPLAPQRTHQQWPLVDPGTHRPQGLYAPAIRQGCGISSAETEGGGWGPLHTEDRASFQGLDDKLLLRRAGSLQRLGGGREDAK